MNDPPRVIRRRVGRLAAEWVETTRDATQARVWRVTGAPPVYVKAHRTPGKYRRERDLLPRLAADELGPPLLDCDDGLRLLVIGVCPGHPPRDPPDWRAAGAALRRLHRLPCAADPLPLAEAIPRRLAGWRARGALDGATLDGLAARVDGRHFDGVGRVLCHRDYAPRNWRVRDGVARMFDLEHAGPDAPEADLVRLYDEPAFDDPAVRAAFYAGYGHDPHPQRLATMLALHALATLTWGRQHGDPAFVERGERLAARVLAGGVGKDPAHR